MSSEKDLLVSRLSNVLKLPKAQRWVCCEWFYSDIDKVIFESENDFSLCIKQSFPRLKTRMLSRKQWCILRSLIGKPRRCSDAFFQEERHMLDEKRHKIRLVQQRKVSEAELAEFKDIPQEIPLPLSIGHRVYAHISEPEEGVFVGTIAAIDTVEYTYRVVFDRASLGSHTVADFEIKSLSPVQAIPIKAYIQTFRPKSSHPTPMKTPLSQQHHLTPLLFGDDLNAMFSNSAVDSMLRFNSPLNLTELNEMSYSALNDASTTSVNDGAMLGGFPVRLLLLITRLNKILKAKKELVQKLDTFNGNAEVARVLKGCYSRDFQMKYAMLVLELEKLNKDLSEHLAAVQCLCEEFAPDMKIFSETGHNAEEMRKMCVIEAREIVAQANSSDEVSVVKCGRATELVTKLTALVLQIRDFAAMPADVGSAKSDSEMGFVRRTSFIDTQSLQLALADIKKDLCAKNAPLFEDKVEVHMKQIECGLNQYSKLHAFKDSDDNIDLLISSDVLDDALMSEDSAASSKNA